MADINNNLDNDHEQGLSPVEQAAIVLLSRQRRSREAHAASREPAAATRAPAISW